MTPAPDSSAPAAPTVLALPVAERSLLSLWAGAAAIAALGSWLLFDATPGANWSVWTALAAVGLAVFAERRPLAPHEAGAVRAPTWVRALPMLIAGAAALTSSEVLAALIALSVAVLLAVQLLLDIGLPLSRLSAPVVVLAPLLAFRTAVLQALHRSHEATQLIRSGRARATVRGIVITLPVLVIFALLLSNADPVFGAGRQALGALLANWDFVPRLLFCAVLMVLVLGAYGAASALPTETIHAPGVEPVRWLGGTERVMLLAGVALLFWLFLAMQLGYLFGTLPQLPSSGITFADYARRGFGELSVVASASALLIVMSERYGTADGRGALIRVLTFAVLAAVLLMLGSAVRRVWLYEAAYGSTTARLYAQMYMAAVALGLVMLQREVTGQFDAGRLFRRSAVAALLLFIGLLYWNHEAWIARRNIDRFAETAQLDLDYLTRELSADAVPAIVQRLPSLPEPMRAELLRRLQERQAARTAGRARRWFEWNLASRRAANALAAATAT